jgi:hypothetical protein
MIGTNEYLPANQDPSASFVWMVVVDLTNLNVVANEMTQPSTVPANIQKYANNPQYFLFTAGNNLWASGIPQGDLYDFLRKAGAGRELDRCEQVFSQLNTGWLPNFSYVLAATLAENDLPGFEAFSTTTYSILTMAFLPITNNNQTVYAAISQDAM